MSQPAPLAPRLGALCLGGALLILTALVLRPALREAVAARELPYDLPFTAALFLWLAWCAWRGGRISLWLAKAFALVQAVLLSVVAVGIPITFLVGNHRFEPTVVNSLALLANVAAAAFSAWALFLSPEVRTFIATQQARYAPAALPARPRKRSRNRAC